MKKILKTFSLLVFASLLFVSKLMASTDPLVEKNKSYSKSYVIGNDKVVINNSFGELKISTWTGNEVKVDIKMNAKAETDSRAQELLDHIQILDSKGNGEINFKTEFKHDDNSSSYHDNKDGKQKRREEKFSVDYIVYLPSSAKLDATNSFGPLVMGDYDGPLTVLSKFGSLTAGRLMQPDKVSVEFGKGSVQQINGGDVIIKFSRFEANKLSNDVNAKLEFCNGIKLGLDNSLKKFKLQSNYSTTYLVVSKDLSAEYEIRSKFGDVKNESEFNISEERKNDDNRFGPRMEKNYTGRSGSGALNVHANNEFGKIIFTHHIDFDVNSKSSDK